MKEKQDTCILLCTNDKYQMPLITADTLSELAQMLGVAYSTVHRAYRTQQPIRLPKGRFEHKTGLVLKIDLNEEI